MPGKKGLYGRFMTEPAVYRQNIQAADSNVDADIETIPECIVMDAPDDVAQQSDARTCDYATRNFLHLQVCVPPTITQFNVEVWGRMDRSLVVQNAGYAWSFVGGVNAMVRSAYVTLGDLPFREIKVLITNITGNFSGGPASIIYSKTS